MSLRKIKSKNAGLLLLFIIFIVSFAIAVLCASLNKSAEDTPSIITKEEETTQLKIETLADAQKFVYDYAQKNDINYNEYPQSLIELLAKNGETMDFVLSYPAEHNEKHKVDLSEYKKTQGVPLFMQWDKRWGYIEYGSDVAGLTACGPTCLSMCAYYFTRSDDMSPDKMIAFSKKNGYCIKGSGSSWSLISEGGKKLGLDVVEIPLVEKRMADNLNAGNLIICIMGPGDFTNKGHYIVLTGYKDGKFSVNDPNSYKNSEKLWTFDEIKGQIRNLWVIIEKRS